MDLLLFWSCLLYRNESPMSSLGKLRHSDSVVSLMRCAGKGYFHLKCAALVSMVPSASDGSLDQKTSTEEVEKNFRAFNSAIDVELDVWY